MASLVPVLTSTIVSQGAGLIANELSGRRSDNSKDIALEQLRAQQSLQEQQSAADAALNKQKIAIDAQEAEEERKKALRRAVSRQRANFGAQGISSGSGSSQAVLLGLFEESDAEKQKREQLDALRITSIDQDLAQQKSLNVLQRTQLQEKQKINQLSTGERLFGSLF
ncbi:MAG: transporter [Alphaproteobacteria bacterium]